MQNKTDNLYGNMSQDQLNEAYNNVLAVKDSAELMKDFFERGKSCYEKNAVQRNIPYSSNPRTCFDFFRADKKHAPTLIFIHGGYWHHCVKEDFAFIAESPLNSGINVILAEYNLAPEASMGQIVKEIGLLLDFLQDHKVEFNIIPGKVCLSGHSAGGHLTAVHRYHPLISHALPLSALVDLEPISYWLRDELSLTSEEISLYSPIRHVRKGVPTSVYVGGEELPELLKHSREYTCELIKYGNDVIYGEIPKANHFTLLNEFRQDGILHKALLSFWNE